MKNILITGGAGFIGSHAVEGFLNRGFKVTVYDNFSYGKKSNLKSFKNQIKIIDGDIRDKEKLLSAMKGCEYVLHLAALRSVPLSAKYPHEFLDVNILGLLNVLEAAAENKVKRVVFSSSSSVYGRENKPPFNEDMKPKPASVYAITKHTGENLCQYFNREHGLDTVALRYFNVFGPRQDPNSQYSGVISIFIKKFLRGEQPIIYGDGEQSRDFTYVSDNVEANIKAITKPNLAGQIINVCNGKPATLNEIVSKLNNIIGNSIEPVYTEPRPGDLYLTHGDPSKARRLLDYKTGVDINRGLARTVEWVKSTLQ